MVDLKNLLKSEHQILVERATKYLHIHCYVVATEIKSITSMESPDVIGWNGADSMLIECKSSIEDFKQDQEKLFRKFPEKGMGDKRYYFTYPDLIKQYMLPNGWGLIELHGKDIKIVRQSTIFKANKIQEIDLLVKLLRRVGKYVPETMKIDYYDKKEHFKGITFSEPLVEATKTLKT